MAGVYPKATTERKELKIKVLFAFIFLLSQPPLEAVEPYLPLEVPRCNQVQSLLLAGDPDRCPQHPVYRLRAPQPASLADPFAR